MKNSKKLRVGVLFGGRSGEHEISLLSAASVLNAIDKTKYDVVPIGITKEGSWVTSTHAEALLQGKPAVSVGMTFTDNAKPARTLLIGKAREGKPGFFATA